MGMASVAAPIPRASPERGDHVARAVALARGAAPLRRALCAVAGRVVAARAWEALGYARVGDYARERAGISGRQLHQLGHVNAAFARVPRLAQAFEAGEIDWSRASLLARVVSEDDVEAWLAFARARSVQALAREVREVDRRARGPGPDARDEGPRVNVRLRLSREARAKWSCVRLAAPKVAGERVRPGAALEMVLAEVSASIGCGEGEPVQREERLVAGARPAAPALRPEARPRAATSPSLAGATEGPEADAFELDRRLRRLLHLEARRTAELAPRLHEIAEGRLYRPLYPSVAAFARECLGLAPRTAEALLRLERAGRRVPTLGEAWHSGRVTWPQAHALLPLLLREEAEPFAAGWVAHARRVTVRRLEEDVERAIAAGDPAPPEEPQMSARRMRSGAGLEPLHVYDVPVAVARRLRTLLARVQRRLERHSGRPSSESDAFEAILEHALASWRALEPRIPADRRIYARDGWRCAVPGCTSYRNLHAHHIAFRSHGGGDDPENLITLCAWHHHRAVHARKMRILGTAPDGLVFELGLRPGQPPRARYASGDRILPPGETTDTIDTTKPGRILAIGESGPLRARPAP